MASPKNNVEDDITTSTLATLLRRRRSVAGGTTAGIGTGIGDTSTPQQSFQTLYRTLITAHNGTGTATKAVSVRPRPRARPTPSPLVIDDEETGIGSAIGTGTGTGSGSGIGNGNGIHNGNSNPNSNPNNNPNCNLSATPKSKTKINGPPTTPTHTQTQTHKSASLQPQKWIGTQGILHRAIETPKHQTRRKQRDAIPTSNYYPEDDESEINEHLEHHENHEHADTNEHNDHDKATNYEWRRGRTRQRTLSCARPDTSENTTTKQNQTTPTPSTPRRASLSVRSRAKQYAETVAAARAARRASSLTRTSIMATPKANARERASSVTRVAEKHERHAYARRVSYGDAKDSCDGGLHTSTNLIDMNCVTQQKHHVNDMHLTSRSADGPSNTMRQQYGRRNSVGTTTGRRRSISSTINDDMLSTRSAGELMSARHYEQESILNYAKQGKRPIGIGAFGVVWSVKHVKTFERFALKIINKEKAIKKGYTAQELQDLVRNEIRVLTLEGLSGKYGLMPLLSSWEDDEKYYLRFPLCGGDLYTLLSKFGPTNEECARYITASIILGLEAMHAVRCVHRDVKPENILVGRDGTIYVSDFGTSKVMPDDGSRLHDLCGTLLYSCPSIVRWGENGIEAEPEGHGLEVDCWSLAVVLYLMLTGTLPFHAGEGEEEATCKLIKEAEVKFPDNVRLTPDVKDLIRCMLVADVSRSPLHYKLFFLLRDV